RARPHRDWGRATAANPRPGQANRPGSRGQAQTAIARSSLSLAVPSFLPSASCQALPRFVWMIQKVVKRCILPGQAVLVRQLLEASHVVLSEAAARFLIIRVAVIHPAAQRPWLAGGAQLVFLKRTKSARDRHLIGGSPRQQDVRLQVTQEQD